MEPFLLAIIDVITLNHRPKAHPIAEAIPWLIRINGVALIVHLHHLLRHLTLVSLSCASLPLGCRFPLANGAVTAAASRTDNTGGGAFGTFSRLLNFGNRCVARRTGTARSIHGQ